MQSAAARLLPGATKRRNITMNYLIVLLASALALPGAAVSFVHSPNPSNTPRKTIVQGVPCAEPVKYFDSGKLDHCVLADEYSVAESSLPQGSEVFFNPTGRLSHSRLARATLFRGQALPANATVFFDGETRIRSFWVASDTEIQGHMIRGHEDGLGNVLYPNGKLRAIWLARDEVIDGIPCTSSLNVRELGLRVIFLGARRMVWFYDDGKLQQAMLSQDISIRGRKLRKGEVVYFRPDGTPDVNERKLGT